MNQLEFFESNSESSSVSKTALLVLLQVLVAWGLLFNKDAEKANSVTLKPQAEAQTVAFKP